jgi:hypothetical protein
MTFISMPAGRGYNRGIPPFQVDVAATHGAEPRVKWRIHCLPSKLAKVDLEDEPDPLAVIPEEVLGLQQDVAIEGW